MSLTQDVERGRLAAEVKNNPVYAEAYDLIDAEIVTQWRSAKTPEEREHLHRMQSCLYRLKSALNQAMDSGKVAAEKLRAEERRGLMSRLGSGR